MTKWIMPQMVAFITILAVTTPTIVTALTAGQSARGDWLGTFIPISEVNGNPSCVAGGNCCCSTGNIVLRAGASPVGDTFDASGPTDGGDACYGLPVMSGTFVVYNQSVAISRIAALNKYLVMKKSDTGDSIFLYANDDCVTVATRQSISSISSTGSNSPSTSTGTYTYTGSGGSSDLAFVPPIPDKIGTISGDIFFTRVITNIGTNQYMLSVNVNSTSHPSPLQWVILRLVNTNGLLVNVQMFPITAYQFQYKPITIAPGQSVQYSLSFKEITSINAYDTPVYTYAVANIPSSTGSHQSSTGMSSTGTNVNMSWVDTRTIPWLGTYQTDNTCVPSDTCCCSVGNMIASPLAESKGATIPKFIFTGRMSGGDVCAGRTDFEAIFDVTPSNLNQATYQIGTLSFTASLSPPSQPTGAAIGALGTKLTMINSVYATCPSIGYKTVMFVPYNEPSSSSTGPSYPPADYASLMSGHFEFDASCTPSKTCCCGVGPLMISKNSTSSSSSSSSLGSLAVSSAFDSGIGCFGFTSMTAVFTIASPTTAMYTQSGITFTMTYSNNYTNIVVSDTFRSCVSTANRYKITTPSNDSRSSANDSIVTYILIGAVTLAIVIYSRNFNHLRG